MKRVVRYGVFETNSSSTHSLILLKRDTLAEDRKQEKPQYKRYALVESKHDKLYLACGCCAELYEDNQYYEGEEIDEARRKFAEGEDIDFFDTMPYDIALRLIIEEYCKQTGDKYEVIAKEIDNYSKKNYCHMKFFEYGALDSAEWDYDVIRRFFWGTEDDMRSKIAYYFEDDNILAYREFYCGIRPDDED